MIHPEQAEADTAPSAAGLSTGSALEFRRAAPGVAVLLFALLSPWSIAGAQTAVVLLALALGAAWVRGRGMRLSAAESAHGQRRENLPWTLRLVLLFLAVQALSIPLGVDPGRAWRAFAGSWVMLFPFLFWFGMRDQWLRRMALRVFAASGGLAGLYGLAQHFLGQDWLRGRTLERLGGGYMAVGTLGHHLSYAGVLLPAFFVALALALGARRRWFWIPVAALIGGGILFSYARTAWVGLAGGLFCLGLVRGRRTLCLSLGGLVAISAIVLLAEPAVLQRFGAMLRLGEDPRSRLWLTALHIGRDHPWMGAGLGSWDVLFPLYRLPGRYMSTAHPHSDVLNILVETGVPGVIAWLGIWSAYCLGTIRSMLLRAAPGRACLEDLWMPAAIGAGVAALLIGGLGQCFSTDEKVAQVWWFLVAAGLREARSSAGRPEARDGIGRSGIRSAIGPREAGAKGEDHAAAPLR